LRAADIFLENGVYTGPARTSMPSSINFFLNVYEPGGNRVEAANGGAHLIFLRRTGRRGGRR
jgi:hypothetical protein